MRPAATLRASRRLRSDRRTGPATKIAVIVLTYPNYLCADEGSGDFVKYITFYRPFIQELFPDVKSVLTVSEGQAAAIFATEQFEDPVFGTDTAQRRGLFESMGERSSLSVLVADGGSSSLNLQVVDIYYDEEGNFLEGQSIVGRDWLTGTQGGSHVANDSVLRHLEKEFAGVLRSGEMGPGELAAFVRDFETKKRNLDFDAYIRDGGMIMLHGGTKRVSVLEADRLRAVFDDAFDEGLKVLRQSIEKLVDYGADFMALLVGGSYSNPGLRRKVEAYMEEVTSTAAERGIKVGHSFLHDKEEYPTSAVSAGAALAGINLPDPVSILRRSAIGIQVLAPDEEGTDPEAWVGEDEANFMFQPGCQESFTSEINTQMYPRRRARFSLICDPRYSPRQQKKRLIFPPLRINKQQSSGVGGVAQGTIYLYDLDWDIDASELPGGRVRFFFRGIHMQHLIRNKNYSSVTRKPIPVTFSCVAMD